MAQSGYTPIQLYYSTTASNTPSTSNLKLGELAYNIADNKVYALNATSSGIQTVVGTLGNQNKNAVSITGGAIDGTTIGATTAAAITGTTITANTQFNGPGTGLTGTASSLSIGGSAPAGSLSGTTLNSTVVSSSLTSVGTLTTGTWNATTIAVAYGGTNATTASITAFNNITGYSASGATGTTSTNLVFSTSPTITTPSISGNATLSTGNLVISAANKGITSSAGFFVQNYESVASGGTLDLTLPTSGFVGILSVSDTRDNYTPQSRRVVYAISCYSTTLSTSQLLLQDGSGGGTSFTITVPSAGTLRWTDTSGDGSTHSVCLTFSGSASAG